MNNDPLQHINTHPPNDIKLFFEGWELYQRVVENNYMKHQEMIKLLQAWIDNCQKPSLRILELGCGDAYVTSHLSQNTRIATYCGIDFSAMAISFAAQKLSHKVDSLDLHEGDMQTCIDSINTEFDIIIAGHSLHHLSLDGKRTIFQKCRKLIAADGCFFFYDLANRSSENREEFLHRCVDYFESHWTNMSNKQLAMVREHVLQQDFPVSPNEWAEIATAAGFKRNSCKYRDEQEMYVSFEFSC